MKLRSLAVNQFKKFTSPTSLEGIEDGLNVVVGPNELGIIYQSHNFPLSLGILNDFHGPQNSAGKFVWRGLDLDRFLTLRLLRLIAVGLHAYGRLRGGFPVDHDPLRYVPISHAKRLRIHRASPCRR